MKFYLDEDLSDRVAAIARARGLDVISSHECGRDGLPDNEQLRLAAEDRRCMVTRNRDDFVQLTVQFFEQQLPHAGVLIVPRSLPNADAARIADALGAFAESHADAVMDYAWTFLTARR